MHASLSALILLLLLGRRLAYSWTARDCHAVQVEQAMLTRITEAQALLATSPASTTSTRSALRQALQPSSITAPELQPSVDTANLVTPSFFQQSQVQPACLCTLLFL
jgi:hypothetical protein